MKVKANYDLLDLMVLFVSNPKIQLDIYTIIDSNAMLY